MLSGSNYAGLTKKLKNTSLDKDGPKVQSNNQSNPTTQAAASPTTINSSTVKPGLLTVVVSQAKGLSLPPGCSVPNKPAVARHQRADSTRASRSNQWWLPYVLVEVDKNEVLIDALCAGSTLENPRWEYKTTL